MTFLEQPNSSYAYEVTARSDGSNQEGHPSTWDRNYLLIGSIDHGGSLVNITIEDNEVSEWQGLLNVSAYYPVSEDSAEGTNASLTLDYDGFDFVIISSFAYNTTTGSVVPFIDPDNNTVMPSYTDSDITFTDMQDGSQTGPRLRGWGGGLHWDYGNTVRITSDDGNLIGLDQIKLGWLSENNVDSDTTTQDLFVTIQGSNGYNYTVHPESITEIEDCFDWDGDGVDDDCSYYYDVDWGTADDETLAFADEFDGSSYIDIEISEKTMVVIQDVEVTFVQKTLTSLPRRFHWRCFDMGLGLG